MNEIFWRTDIQQIREFLLHGVEKLNIDPRTYKKWLESTQTRMTVRMREEYPDSEGYEEIIGLLFEYVGEVEDVYMEIGLQAGAILAVQTAQSLKTSFEGE